MRQGRPAFQVSSSFDWNEIREKIKESVPQLTRVSDQSDCNSPFSGGINIASIPLFVKRKFNRRSVQLEVSQENFIHMFSSHWQSTESGFVAVSPVELHCVPND